MLLDPEHEARMDEEDVISEKARLFMSRIESGCGRGQREAGQLHRYVRYDDAEGAEWLVKKGANVDGRASDMQATPLHVAAEFASVNCTELLLQHDANPNLRDSLTRTPLDVAISFYQASYDCQVTFWEEREAIIEMLLNAGADINDGFYNWLSRTIVQYGHVDLLHMEPAKILLKYMAKMEPKNLRIHEQNLELIREHDCLESFYNLCRQEIALMLEVKLFNKVTLYDFMVKSTRVMSLFPNDEEIMLEVKKCKQQIPIYYENLEKRFAAAMQRKRLMRCASSALSFVMNYCIDERHIVTQKIINFLDTEDLKNLVIMYESLINWVRTN